MDTTNKFAYLQSLKLELEKQETKLEELNKLSLNLESSVKNCHVCIIEAKEELTNLKKKIENLQNEEIKPSNLDKWLFALRSHANGRIVSAENFGNSSLVANRKWIETWEKFEMEELHNGLVAIKAVINQRYLSLVNDEGIIMASAETISSSEIFSIHYLDNSNRIAIKSESNGKFVSATLWGWGKLKADKDYVLAWETFDLIKL
jgi:hypothetical protein